VSSTQERRRAPDPTWTSPEGEPPPVAIGPLGWAMIAWRLPLMGLVVFGGLALLLALRVVERPLFGLRRPLTPHVTQAVCRAVFPIMGLALTRQGRPMRGRGALVANHSSWLDIFALNALQRIYFVSKSEVAGWPGIGWLARATGTVFINRHARDARLQKEVFEARLRAGHQLCFFPEGTSTDGLRVLPFKPTLFAAFFTHGLDTFIAIQPVSLIYRAPPGRDARFYGWWGEMGFGTHMLRVLAQTRQGQVTVVFHPAIPVSETAERKALARRCEDAVRAGLDAHLPADAQ
jgi:lyso-ornithine lipid O-acyltransferase